MEAKQKEFLKQHFVKGYKPSESELLEMQKKLELKGRLPESYWRC